VSLTLAWCGKTRHGGGSSSRGPLDKINSVMTMMSWEYVRVGATDGGIDCCRSLYIQMRCKNKTGWDGSTSKEKERVGQVGILGDEWCGYNYNGSGDSWRFGPPLTLTHCVDRASFNCPQSHGSRVLRCNAFSDRILVHSSVVGACILASVQTHLLDSVTNLKLCKLPSHQQKKDHSHVQISRIQPRSKSIGSTLAPPFVQTRTYPSVL